MNSTLESIQFFYHVIMSLTLMVCCSIIFSFWIKVKTPNNISKNGMLFAAMIVLTWALSSMGYLFSKLFPIQAHDANLLTSIFRVMSLFNNLFLFLFLPYLGVFQRFRNDRYNFSITIIAIIIVMLSFILDRVSFDNNNFGHLAVAFIDTLLSAPIILFFGYGLNRYCKKYFPDITILLVFNVLSIGVLFLITLSSMAMPLFNLYENEKIVQNFHLVYFIHYPSLFYLMVLLVLISYRMYLQFEQLSIAAVRTGDGMADLESGLLVAEDSRETLPKSLHFDYHADKQIFQLTLVCRQDETDLNYTWTGINCTYPFFYWLYLSVALKQQIPVEIKDSQVNRNRMLRMLDKDLSPRFFIHLNGSVASLNLPAEQVFIGRQLIQHNAVKAKFKEHIDPFLVLTPHDRKRYDHDWTYANEVFERVYQLLF